MKISKPSLIDKKTHKKCFTCNRYCERSRSNMLSIFRSQEKFQKIAPVFGWRGLGNVLGDYGEYMAFRHYDIVKSRNAAKDHDGCLPDGGGVQIKTCLHSDTVSYRGIPQNLLVLRVDGTGSMQEIYAGPFAHITAKFDDKASAMKEQLSTTDKKFRLKVSDLIALNIHAIPRRECSFHLFLQNATPPTTGIDRVDLSSESDPDDADGYGCDEILAQLSD
ncbi:DUF6998 domain-containing protein [Rhizobium leguminosarum]|uniref:DUF6998 domain-containing protein n=2 Tax=Rhizobium TaxID=379 RepID=UPI003D6DE12B